MAATNRSDKVKLLVKMLQKRYKHFPKYAERNLLECLMFAACLENATFDAAESAYSVLEHHYIDWNELRVSTPQEIADTLPMLPKPFEAGERIKKTLQWVFETTYMFDLEDYRKKTIGQTIEYLDSIPSSTQFMANYLVQVGLGGHHIPVDEAALRILRRLDLTKVNNGREEVPGLERIVTKGKSIEFATLIHLFGMEFFDRQNDEELLALLQNIDKNAAGRTWQEPEGLFKQPDFKPVPARIPQPRHSGFKPVIDLDDDESEPIGNTSKEESNEYIDTDLDSLESGMKGTEEQVDDTGTSKRKKHTSTKTDSKKKTSGQVTSPKPGAILPHFDAPSNVEPTKKNVKKKTKVKSTPVHIKPETKKTSFLKKDTKTPKKSPKPVPKKGQKKSEPKKPTKAAPPKSATKKLQQKKPR